MKTPIRSMTGYAQVKSAAGEPGGFTLSLKSVNHRFLDLHLRLPAECDALEMKLRRALKERLMRGHVELTLSLERGGAAPLSVNKEFVGAYINAYQIAAMQFDVKAEPDLNAILKLPGALTAAPAVADDNFGSAVLAALAEAVAQLNQMREAEGKEIARDLRERAERLSEAVAQVEKLRAAVTPAYMKKIESRMQELLGAKVEHDRLLQEAALLAERSDVEEEIVRLRAHLRHFLGLLDSGGEAGKKLDFLLQEMNREANTLSAKTSGLAGEGLLITELGLAMKAEIEKLREQVQNVE
ncbi:MAG TPA: YicC/YloC family endoribonuclease [Terriglobales bacterium]|nr:YicC/YloC family endoribonuclease [Terriglobales bacterium]